MAAERCVLLKLGGSLITDKNRPHTARPEVLARIAQELVAARQQDPGLRLVLGHGSGSFGHVPASRYGTRQGVAGEEAWRGFAEVGYEATRLNHIVMQALTQAGLPALPFPPSASVMAEDGKAQAWLLDPLLAALQHGLLPVVYASGSRTKPNSSEEKRIRSSARRERCTPASVPTNAACRSPRKLARRCSRWKMPGKRSCWPGAVGNGWA